MTSQCMKLVLVSFTLNYSAKCALLSCLRGVHVLREALVESAALLSACTLGPPRYELDQPLEKGFGRYIASYNRSTPSTETE